MTSYSAAADGAASAGLFIRFAGGACFYAAVSPHSGPYRVFRDALHTQNLFP